MRYLLLSTILIAVLIGPGRVYAQYPAYKPLKALKTKAANKWSPDPLFGYRWKNTAATDDLEIYHLKPKTCITATPQSFDLGKLASHNIISIKGTGSIRFDFGQVNAGWLEFEAPDMPDSITLSISEYDQPAVLNQGAANPIKTLAPAKHGNVYRLELNAELYEGVRFGWLHVISHKRAWVLKNLRLVCQTKPVNYLGSFACSDEVLNRVWYTGAYTVKLNIMKDHLGAILMERSDRHSWTGDAYPSQAASMVAFGNYDMIKTNLTHTATLDNSIPGYALYWVLSLVDYVNYSGDTAFGRSYLENAKKKLDAAYAMFDDPKNLNFYGWDERLGAGFENATNPETRRAYRFLAIHCWVAFSKLCATLGQKQQGDKYAAYAAEKLKQIRADTAWTKQVGLHASADAINTGLTTYAENGQLYQKNYTSRVNRLSYSPFNQYFILQSLGRIDKYDDAISIIKDMWGGQLAYGGTTFFEVFRPSWNTILSKNAAPVNNQCGYTSLTHPWSAGVVQWLTEEVAGIKPLSPGFKTFTVSPHPDAGLSWVNASVPTPFGTISTAVNQPMGVFKLSIPAGTRAESISLPLAGTLKAVYLNDKLIWKPGDIRHGAPSVTKDSLLLRSIGAGNYVYRLVYSSKLKITAPAQPEWDYAIRSFGQDSITAGNWNAKFGKQGFVLFNYLDNGKHLEKLPPYVSKIRLNLQANVHLPATAKADGILNDTAGQNKSIGAIITQDPIPCKQTMTIDIHATDTQEHRVSVYFFDWDDQGRRSALEVFDLDSLDLLAPVQLIDHYQKGKYLTFKFKGSIRLRVDQVRGKNAAVSGLFFDEAVTNL